MNSYNEELKFLISIMTDLMHNYKDHNQKLLSEIISQLSYKLQDK